MQTPALLGAISMMAAIRRRGYALCKVAAGEVPVTTGQGGSAGPLAAGADHHMALRMVALATKEGLTIMGVPAAHGTPDTCSWVSCAIGECDDSTG
jgi:hypothetical protein